MKIELLSMEELSKLAKTPYINRNLRIRCLEALNNREERLFGGKKFSHSGRPRISNYVPDLL